MEEKKGKISKHNQILVRLSPYDYAITKLATLYSGLGEGTSKSINAFARESIVKESMALFNEIGVTKKVLEKIKDLPKDIQKEVIDIAIPIDAQRQRCGDEVSNIAEEEEEGLEVDEDDEAHYLNQEALPDDNLLEGLEDDK